MNSAPDPSMIMTPDELIKHLKVSKATLYRWTCQKGEDSIPRLYYGKHLRFNWPDVCAWAENRAT